MTNNSAGRSGRDSPLSPQQRMAFVEYLHAQPLAHFTRPQLATALREQTGVTYHPHYLPVVLHELGLRYYKPRPVSVRRAPQAKEALIERLKATFDGLQAMGYDLDRVAFGFADESSPQLSANTARLWSIGKAERVVNTDKQRANTFGFLALNGMDYCQPLADSSAESFRALFPKIRALHGDYEAVVVLWDNLPAHKTVAVEAAARRHQIYLVYNLPYAPDLNPIEGVWKGIKRRISEWGLMDSLDQLRNLVQGWFIELTASSSLAKQWMEDILLRALPPKSAISFCKPFS
nr:IS630 family transposase [Spirosoma utsteinense]